MKVIVISKKIQYTNHLLLHAQHIVSYFYLTLDELRKTRGTPMKEYLVTGSQIHDVVAFVMDSLDNTYKGFIIMAQLVLFKSFKALHSALIIEEDIIRRANEDHEEPTAFYDNHDKGKDTHGKGKSGKGNRKGHHRSPRCDDQTSLADTRTSDNRTRNSNHNNRSVPNNSLQPTIVISSKSVAPPLLPTSASLCFGIMCSLCPFNLSAMQ